MNRWLIAVVGGLLAVGCAAGVEDPTPEPSGERPERSAPAETFSAELEEQLEETTPPELPVFELADIPEFEKPDPGF